MADATTGSTRDALIIDQNFDAVPAIITLSGELDTLTSPLLDGVTESLDPSITDLVLDCAGLTYISSAGLRSVLKLQKLLNKRNGSLVLTEVGDNVYEVFELTRFVDFIHVEH